METKWIVLIGIAAFIAGGAISCLVYKKVDEKKKEEATTEVEQTTEETDTESGSGE